MAVAVHLDGNVDGLQKRGLIDAGENEVAFVKGFGTLGGGSDADGGNRFSYREKETALLWERAGIADHGE